MAEVLGIISAVVGVAEVGFNLSIAIYKYTKAVANPSKAIADIDPEVSLLSAVMTQLGCSLKDDEYLGLCKGETLVRTQKIAVACMDALTEIERIIKGYFQNNNISVVDRLKRYSMEKKVNLIRANLDHLKSTVILMLEVIKYARGIVKHQQSPKERDRVILVQLEQASKDAERRYQKLLSAIGNPINKVQDYLPSPEISTSNSEASGSTRQSYAIVDKTGAIISEKSCDNDEILKLENISRLISEIEDTQNAIAEGIWDRGIWEVSLVKGEPNHYRHTEIKRQPKMHGIDGTRSITSTQHVIEHRITDVYIALVGAVGAGKSTFVNLCCGKILATVSQGHGHCTEAIEEYHFMYTPEIRVHLIDTPGFDDAHRGERDILTDLAEWISKSLGATLLSGIIYFHKISELRIHFHARRNLRMFEKLCGHDAAHSVILATTNWDVLGDPNTPVQHEQELLSRDEYWGSMIKYGSALLRHTGDYESAMHILGTLGVLADTKPVAIDDDDPHTEAMERKRGFSESSVAFEPMNAEAKVNQLLAEYTTVVDVPQAQGRRWTMDSIF